MSKIVEDGPRRLLRDPETRKQIQEAVGKVRRRYERDLAQAGFWKRLWLAWKMEREIKILSKEIVAAVLGRKAA